MIAIPLLDGLTQARNCAEVETMAREYIASATSVSIDAFDLNIDFGEEEGT